MHFSRFMWHFWIDTLFISYSAWKLCNNKAVWMRNISLSLSVGLSIRPSHIHSYQLQHESVSDGCEPVTTTLRLADSLCFIDYCALADTHTDNHVFNLLVYINKVINCFSLLLIPAQRLLCKKLALLI